MLSLYNHYLFTKFHTSKYLGKRVTQTCIPYCNVWAEVVYCGFPKSKEFTKTLLCLFPACHQSLYISLPSFICGCTCTPVSEIHEFNQKKKKMNNSEKGIFAFDTFPIDKKNLFFSQLLWWYSHNDVNMSPFDC